MTRSIALVVVAAVHALCAASASASLPIAPDVTVQMLGTTVTDDDVVGEYPPGVPQFADLGVFPATAEVDAYSHTADGEHLFSLDTTVSFPSGVTARPADVVRFDGLGHSIEFDAAGFGLPDGVNVDAVMESGGMLVLSFDTSIGIGGGAVAADEDLVIVVGPSLVSFFDGSGAGIDPALDLDAAAAAASGGLLLSFDQAGSVGGLDFDDDMVLEFDTPTWTVAMDASASFVGFEAADVVAVPEPGVPAALAVGSALVAVLARRRARA